MTNQFYQQGYIALVLILIVSSLVVLIAVSAILFSVGENDMSLANQKSLEAYYFASACAEKALMELKGDLHYDGDETIEFEDGLCYISPIRGEGQSRTITVKAMSGLAYRRIKIEVARLRPDIRISSFEEVADF